MSTPDVQYWSVARHIAARIHAGTRPEDIAVLARDNRDAVAAGEFLQKLSIPFSLSTQQDLLADPYLHQLIRILDAVRAFGSPAPLLTALHAPILNIAPLDLYKLTVFCRSGRNPYDVMRSPALMHEAGIDEAQSMQALATRLASWARLAQQPQAAEALEVIVRESGLLGGILQDPMAIDVLSRLHTVYDMLTSRVQRDRTLTLVQFAEHLDFLHAHGITLSAHTGMVLPGRVRVMTAHKSKGLEFDCVYILDAVDGHWGSRKRRELIRLPAAVFLASTPAATRDAPRDLDDEERNLFYVALTRARKHVVISLSRTASDGSELLPTRYLADINTQLITHTDLAELERAWALESAVRYQEAPPHAPQATDIVYLNELFRRQGLSVTALNNYLACPWRYFYSNLVRIPEAPVFALMYGNAIDQALEEYFNRLAIGAQGTKQELVALFDGYARRQPFPQIELETALARGRTALEGYYNHYHTTWHANIINQLRIPAVQLADGLLINGKIDKVERVGASGEVVVIDYKTGKPKSRNQIIGAVKDGDGNYLRQLTFYKLLLDRWQDGAYRMREGVIDFVEPDVRGKWHREIFSIPPESVAQLEELIQKVAGEIRALTFWNTRCGDRDCRYCPLRDLMEKK